MADSTELVPCPCPADHQVSPDVAESVAVATAAGLRLELDEHGEHRQASPAHEPEAAPAQPEVDQAAEERRRWGLVRDGGLEGSASRVAHIKAHPAFPGDVHIGLSH
jgi:hypothetical protein